MSYPFEFSEPEAAVADQIPDGKVAVTLIGPKKYAYLKSSKDLFPKFYNFKARPSDVWIYGYGRSGTTIAQEIVWLIENKLDFEKAAEEVLDLRFPNLERETVFNDACFKIDTNCPDKEILSIGMKLIQPATEQLEEMKGKRLIKTHLPLSLGPSNILESGCKILYLARTPKDAIVSNYSFLRSFNLWDGEFETYWNWIEAGLCHGCPLLEHIKEGWALRNHEKVLFLFYENLIKNMRQTIIKISEFLGKSLTNEQLDQLEEHMKIDNFRKNKSVNNDHLRKLGIMKDQDAQFIRKGTINGGKGYFTGSLSDRYEKWLQENLKQTDLQFPL